MTDFLQTAKNNLGKWIPLTNSGNTQEIIDDIDKLSFREFKKKYKTPYSTSEIQNANLRRMKSEFEKAKLPFSKVWSNAYQKRIKTQKLKAIPQKKKKPINYNYRKTGKFSFQKVTRKGRKTYRWKYPYNIWDYRIKDFIPSYLVKINNYLKFLKQVWQRPNHTSKSFQYCSFYIVYVDTLMVFTGKGWKIPKNPIKRRGHITLKTNAGNIGNKWNLLRLFAEGVQMVRDFRDKKLDSIKRKIYLVRMKSIQVI